MVVAPLSTTPNRRQVIQFTDVTWFVDRSALLYRPPDKNADTVGMLIMVRKHTPESIKV